MPPYLPPGSHQGWVFTINNYTEDHVSLVEDLVCQGMKAGRERGKSGTPHIQGAVYFKNSDKKSLRWMRTKFHGGHFEVMRGSWADQKYCLKDGVVIRDYGTGPRQGKRSDLDSCQALIDEGKPNQDLYAKHFGTMIRYKRGLDEYRDSKRLKTSRSVMTTCTWIYGPTGTGKSHMAYEGYNPDTHYNHQVADNGWWDNYEQQETVIINEFRGEIKYRELLQLLDKWPLMVKRRNRAPIPFVSTKVIITSCLSPELCYPRQADTFDSIDQLLRRLGDNIIHLTERHEDMA